MCVQGWKWEKTRCGQAVKMTDPRPGGRAGVGDVDGRDPVGSSSPWSLEFRHYPECQESEILSGRGTLLNSVF